MWRPTPPWMIQRLKQRGTCPESVLELALDTTPKTLEEAEGRLKCGDIPGAILALIRTSDSILTIKKVMQFYHENICQQAGQPIAHLAPYEPPPPDQWTCSEKALRYMETKLYVIDPAMPTSPIEVRFIDHIQTLLERLRTWYEQLETLTRETKDLHEQCMIYPTTECWERYRQTLKNTIELARRIRDLLGLRIDRRHRKRWFARLFFPRREPKPPEETLREKTLTTIIETLALWLEAFNRIQPEVFTPTYLTPDKINTVVERWITREKKEEEEAKETIEYLKKRPATEEDIKTIEEHLKELKNTVTEIINRLKKTCRPPNQLSAGLCQEWTKTRINRRASTLRKMLEENRITRDRFNMFIKELEDKCIELGGRWDGTRCQ